MTRVTILLALVVGLVSSSAQSKEWYIYNVDGSQVSQPLCDSLVTIRFAATTDTLFMNDLPSTVPGLQSGYSPVSMVNDFWQYGVSAGYDVDTLLANLRSSRYIDYVTPTFEVITGSVWYVYDELLIAFREEVSQQEIDSIANAFSLDIVLEPDSLQDSYLMKVTASSPPDIFDIGNEIYESGLCYYSYPNRSGVDEFYWYPDDDYFNQQWPLYHDSTTPGKVGADIDMQKAWEYAAGTPYIIVAVIDNAFDIDHEDLNQSKLWAPYDAAGATWYGNITDDDPRPPANGVYIWAHGTACLGYISAVTDNATGIAGIAPDCFFMPIKIYSDDYAMSDLTHERGWKWAISENADVISYSIGGGVIPAEQFQIEKAYQEGIAIFCAAGQTASTVSYPACLPETFAVGASDANDNLWSESNRGVDLDILAPSYADGDGVYNWTLDITGYGGFCPTTSACCGVYDYVCKMMGTSAAAPVAAGVAAQVLSHKPTLVCDTCNAEAVYDVIRHSAEDEIHANDPPGYDTLFGWGRVNAARAILSVVRGDVDNNGFINVSDAYYLIN